MAQRAGVDPAILRAVVARDVTAMPFEVALAARFAAEAQTRMCHASPMVNERFPGVTRQFRSV